MSELLGHAPIDLLHASVLTLLIGGRYSADDVWQLGRYLFIGLLVAVLACQTTLVGVDAARGQRAAPQPFSSGAPPALVLPRRRATYDLPVLVAANLFGTAAEVDKPTIEATEWDLLGVIAANEGDKGIAILAQKGHGAHVYLVGDQPLPEVTLTRVLPDRVVLAWADRNEEVLLPHTRLPGGRDATAEVAQGAPDTGYSPPTIERKKEIDMLREQEPHPVLAAQTVMRNGRVSGLMVAPVGNPQAFNALGLKPRDVITKVNGSEATTYASGVDLVQSLEHGTPVSVTVIRGGQQMELSLGTPH